MTKVGENCTCTHPVDPHAIIPLEFDVILGVPDVPVAGVMLCPACDCTATWSVNGYPEPPLPAPEIVAELRRAIKDSAGKASG